jgi:hypothetical protein
LSIELDDEPSNRLVSNVHIEEDARLRGRRHDHDSLSHHLQQQLIIHRRRHFGEGRTK